MIKQDTNLCFISPTCSELLIEVFILPTCSVLLIEDFILPTCSVFLIEDFISPTCSVLLNEDFMKPRHLIIDGLWEKKYKEYTPKNDAHS